MQNHLSNFDGDDSEDYRNKTMLNHLCSHDDISWPGLDIHVVLGGVVYSNFLYLDQMLNFVTMVNYDYPLWFKIEISII